MFVRVVRFTDVTPARADELVARVEASEGPPEGVPPSGLQLLFDEEQGTAVVLQLFASMDDLKTGERVFNAMDGAATPGSRASVDRCAVKVDIPAP